MSETARLRAFKWLHRWHYAYRAAGFTETHDSSSIDTCTHCQSERAKYRMEAEE